MTIVIAQRCGDEILMCADTMVGEPGKTGPDVMPGRLKVVTIGPGVTVAFAGNADLAFVVVRSARDALLRDGLASATELLRDASRKGCVDFLVASHQPEPSLKRLKNGGVLEVDDICAIGDVTPFQSLIERVRGMAEDIPLYKGELRFRFFDRLLTNKDLGPNIGGFPTFVLARPSEHRYQGGSGGYTYTFPTLKWGEETYQSIDQVYTGDGHFQLSLMPSKKFDVPVMGVCLLQARMGYVFSPLEHPQAFPVRLAPPEMAWEGNEQAMFKALEDAIAAHVDRMTAPAIV